MEAVFIKILNMSISAGWLVLAVIAVRFLLKKAPKWVSVLLWGLVGLRLVMPFTIKAGFSLLPSAEVISPSIGYVNNPAIYSGIAAFDNAVNPALGASLAATPGDSVNPMQVWLFVFSILWLAGIAVLLAYGLVSFLRLHKKVSEAVLLRKNVWVCDHVETPFILGLFRPRIYLPSSLDEKDTGYVLSHEQAHLQRKDHIWKPIGFLLLTIYWFNPLIWVAYILLCRDIEMACDEKVITNMEIIEKKAYANALVSCSMQRRLVIACPLAFGEVGVKERVKGVLNYKKPAFWVVTVSVAVCVLVAACFLTDPGVVLSRSADKVEGIVVFDGNTGRGLNITDRTEIKKVVEYVNAMKLRKGKISVGYTGYRFRIAFYPSGSAQDSFILNSPDTVRKGPFFYTVEGETGLYEYLEKLYAANPDTENPDLEKYRTDYIGDAPKVSQIAMRLPYPEDYAYHHIELQSSAEPYGLTIYLAGSGEVTSEDFDTCSDLAFDLIGNLGWIKFQGMDNLDVNVTFSRQAGDALSESDPIYHTNPEIGDSATADARNQLPAPEIDYGTSDLYSREDMDTAIGVILTEFSTWEGFKLHSIRYTSDDCNSPEHIRWLNELNEAAEGDRKLDVTFTQCIEFVSDYHSPKDSDLAGAWNPDKEYTDWQWWLARTDSGEWHLMTMGY